MSDHLIVYVRAGCNAVQQCITILDLYGVQYRQIDIAQDEQSRELVKDLTGFESVPTLLFPDGAVLVEPTAGQLRRAVAAYQHGLHQKDNN